MSASNCCFLTCIQVSQEAGKVVWYSHLFQNFPVCCDPHSQRLWSVKQKWMVLSSFAFSLTQRMLAIWSLISPPFLNPAWTSENHWFIVLLKPRSKDFEHNFAGMWKLHECSCAVVWAFFAIAFLWDWNENWPFPVLWPLLSFPHLLAYWVQHFNHIIF